jgi:hypothetical protein
MNCQRNVNSILPTQLSHKFSYIVAILIHNHFESPNTYVNIFREKGVKSFSKKVWESLNFIKKMGKKSKPFYCYLIQY